MDDGDPFGGEHAYGAWFVLERDVHIHETLVAEMERDIVFGRAVRGINPMPVEPCERLPEMLVVHAAGGDDQGLR